MGILDFTQVSSEGDVLLEKLPEAVGFLVVSEDESLLAAGSVWLSLGSSEEAARGLVGGGEGSGKGGVLDQRLADFLPRAAERSALALWLLVSGRARQPCPCHAKGTAAEISGWCGCVPIRLYGH